MALDEEGKIDRCQIMLGLSTGYFGYGTEFGFYSNRLCH